MSPSSSLPVTIFLCIFFLSVNGNEFTVGGKPGAWKIPPSSSYSFNKWGDKSRFIIGDSLVFSYEAGKDSVLQVTRYAYEKCNTTSPKATYNSDGNTEVKLDQPGPVYFISGTQGHCQKGQKLRLVVFVSHSSAFSPAPSPSDGPAVAPTSGATAKLTSFFVGVVGLVLGLWAF